MAFSKPSKGWSPPWCSVAVQGTEACSCQCNILCVVKIIIAPPLPLQPQWSSRLKFLLNNLRKCLLWNHCCGANNYAKPRLLPDACLGGCDVGECCAMSVKDSYVVSLTGTRRTRKILDHWQALSSCRSLFSLQETWGSSMREMQNDIADVVVLMHSCLVVVICKSIEK